MVIKNFANLIKKEPAVVIMIILSQILSVAIILTAYCIYSRNNNALKAAYMDGTKIYTVQRADNVVPLATMGRIKKEYPDFLGKYEGDLFGAVLQFMYNFQINGEEKRCEICIDFKVKDGRITYDDNTGNVKDNCQGRWYTEEEMNRDSNVCCVSSESDFQVGDKVVLFGKEFEVVGKNNTLISDTIWVPFYSMPDEAEITYANIRFTRHLLRDEAENAAAEFSSFFNDVVPLQIKKDVELEQKQTMRSLIYISVIMGVISAFTILVFGHYIISERMYMTAVYMACGCSRLKALFMYIIEMLPVLAFTSFAGAKLFGGLLKSFFEKRYSWFHTVYNEKNAMTLVIVYFVLISVSWIASVIMSLRRQPMELIKEGRV